MVLKEDKRSLNDFVRYVSHTKSHRFRMQRVYQCHFTKWGLSYKDKDAHFVFHLLE